ncbi:MAG: ATP-binding protein [Candidatus Saccharicenans sp.]
MKLKKFFFQAYLIHLFLLFMLLVVVYFLNIHLVRQAVLDDQVAELSGLAQAISLETANAWLADAQLNKDILSTQARISRIRLTLIDTAGRVIYDSEKEAEELESHRYRPEVVGALSGALSSSVRYSDTLKIKMIYVAAPVKVEEQVVGVCRVSRPVNLAMAAYRRTRNNLLAALGGLLALGALTLVFLIRLIQKPLEALNIAVERAAAGNLDVSLGPFLQQQLKPLPGHLNILLDKNRELQKELEADREVLQVFIDSSDEGWLLVDLNGRIILMSRSFPRMFPEITGKNEFFWQILRLPGLHELTEQARQSSGPVSCQLEKGGRVYHCQVNWLSGRKNYLLKFIDITEAKDLQQRKKEFVANLAHELKTPLTVINGFLETLEDENLSPEGRDYLEVLKRNVSRLVRLVEDLARLSELEEKGSQLEKIPVDLREAVSGVLETFEKEAQKKGLYLKMEAEEIPPVEADPYQIEQMLVNLIDNAIRYTDKGGVTVSLKRSGDGVELTVSDTGIGIPEEHLPRIFERFYVVDRSRSRRTGGTGLGLSIVKHVVLAHGGRIEVRSAPGYGSTFIVWLPAVSGGS